MKALRVIKKSKKLKIEDPEKIAEEKLAIFSDEPFTTSEDNHHSETWVISSFHPTRTNIELNLTHNDLTPKLPKQTQKPFSNFDKRNSYPSISQELVHDGTLKKYFHADELQHQRKSEQILFPERKSLSLTNYILFDKRKSSKPQQDSAKSQFHRFKLLQLKKFLVSRRNQRFNNSSEKASISENKFQSPESRKNIKKSPVEKGKSLAAGQAQNLLDNRKKYYLQASRVVKGKEMPSINVKKYNKQSQLLKQRMQKARLVESSINSTKIKLHQYYEKFVY